jgi:hypothetical protein
MVFGAVLGGIGWLVVVLVVCYYLPNSFFGCPDFER